MSDRVLYHSRFINVFIKWGWLEEISEYSVYKFFQYRFIN